MLATNQAPSHHHRDFLDVVFFSISSSCWWLEPYRNIYLLLVYYNLTKKYASETGKKNPTPYFQILSKIRGSGISGRKAKHGNPPFGLTSC